MSNLNYDLGNLGRVVGEALPILGRYAPSFLPGFAGAERLSGATRAAVQLRLATLYGCPVCRNLIPSLARRAGLSDQGIQSALSGGVKDLSAQASAAVHWVGALIADEQPPPSTATLSSTQQDHLRFMVGVESIVHSVGLLFLPRSMIEKAAAG